MSIHLGAKVIKTLALIMQEGRNGINMIAQPRSGTNRRVPDLDRMKEYRDKGLTQQQIADEWYQDSGTRVTRNAITMAMRRYKLAPVNPLPRYDDLLPWKVRIEHAKHYDARMLRAEGRIRKLPKAKKRLDPDFDRVKSWKEKLDAYGAVIMYDPDTPQGFFWVYREPQDDDLIRRPA